MECPLQWLSKRFQFYHIDKVIFERWYGVSGAIFGILYFRFAIFAFHIVRMVVKES